MLYLPLLVFVIVTFWIAGWHRGLQITLASSFLCLLFGIWWHPVLSSAEVRELPHNFWVVLRAILWFPVYLIQHPGEWLYILLPLAILIVLYVVVAALRKRPATRN